MIKTSFFSLRVLIPVLLATSILLMLAYLFNQQTQHENEEVYGEFSAKQMDIAERLQAEVEHDIRAGLKDRLQQIFSELGLKPEIRLALLADKDDRIIASTNLSLMGSDLMQASQQFLARIWLEELPAPDTAEMTIQQVVYPERNAILASAPVRLDEPGSSLESHTIGRLLIYTDVTYPLAEHRAYVGRQMQQLLIGFGLLALLIGLLLHRIVTRRVTGLLHSAQRVGDGKLDTVAGIGGPDEIGQLGIAFDQMIRKMALSAMQIRKFSLAMEQSPNSIIITDNRGYIEYVNPHFCAVTGYKPEEVIGKNMRMHQSGQTPGEVYEELWRTISSGQIWRGELLNKNRFGKVYWESLCISPILDEQGRITHYLSEQVDITERKYAEEQIRLYEMVFASANEAIMITNADNNIVAVNPAFTEVTGYSVKDVIGRNPRMIASGLMNEEFYKKMWAALNTEGKWQGEIVDRRKDGEVYAEWLSISSVFDASGKITHYIALITDVSERKAAEERMTYLAQHDVLTDLPNRMMFQDRLGQAIAHAGRENTHIALLFMDLDRFKNVNDTLGHHVGDLLLQEVALRIRQCVRNSDTVSRQGGDEFVVMLPDLDDLGDISQIVGKIIESIAHPYAIEGNTIHTTTSIGISIYPQNGTDIETLIRNADTAMYQAKESGRNRYRFFTQEMNNTIARRVKMEGMLRTALENNELLLHYQPKVDLRSGEIIGAEALVRWNHPEQGLISPADFIPVAEETGMIIPLGEWVINEVCRQCSEWRTTGLREIVIAINLSPLQFIARDLIWVIFSALTRHGLPGNALEFEITESGMMVNPEKTVSMLQSIHELGARISIDDFGTGYSSLSHLKKFPIDVLKIDQSFVRDLSVDNDDAAIVKAVISMTKSLNLNVIAEGVETIEQLRFLIDLDCDEMQGYFFSKPLPAGEFRKLLESGRKLVHTQA